jgi:hypothetical protein
MTSRLPSLLLGTVIGMTVMAALPHGQLHIGSSVLDAARMGSHASSSAQPDDLVRSAMEINTAGWNLYRSEAGKYELRYPAAYTVTESNSKVTLRPAERIPDDPTGVELEALQSTPQKEVLPSMQLAGWKMIDRQAYALSTPYFSDEKTNRLWSQYLFLRDLPLQGTSKSTWTVRATASTTFNDPDFARARAAGLRDVDAVLNVPEQILATFHFLPPPEKDSEG